MFDLNFCLYALYYRVIIYLYWFLVVIICLFTSTHIVSPPRLKNASTLCDSGGGGLNAAASLRVAHKESRVPKPHPPGAQQ
jgi:hypothetical protein